MFRARRPLRPMRRPRDRVRGAALTDQNVRLIVHVARAFNVPVRDPQQEQQQGAYVCVCVILDVLRHK